MSVSNPEPLAAGRGLTNIFFKPAGAASMQIPIDVAATVLELRAALASRSASAKQCGLKCGARYLNDPTRSLASYGVGPGATVSAMMGVVGGMPEAEGFDGHASHFEGGGEIVPEPDEPKTKATSSRDVTVAFSKMASDGMLASPGGLDRATSSFQAQKSQVVELDDFTPVSKDELEHDARQEYLDLETGDVIVVHSQQFLDPRRYRKKTADGYVHADKGYVEHGHAAEVEAMDTEMNVGSVKRLMHYVEIDGLAYTWRFWLNMLLLATMDEVNALRITRALQLSVPFLTGYEAFLLDRVNKELEVHHLKKDSSELFHVLSVAFRCRNVSRAIVQSLARHDFIWHQNFQFKWNRWMDAFGQIPLLPTIFGGTGFPGTENSPNTFGHVVSSVFRRVLGKGAWWTRVLTGRQELAVDDQYFIAQNLAAESNGFETANRNQHGSYFGRLKTNKFRLTHRLPTDESVVRTFITQPLSTMLNNGVEHVLNDLANHFRNMLFQPFGNFAHQRMEQLHPAEFMRFHMPVITVALSTLRGISEWDSAVLAPFVAKLQNLTPFKNVDPVKSLIAEMCDEIVDPLCGGIPSRVNPLRRLLDGLDEACDLLEEEAVAVYDLVNSVLTGIALGTQMITSTNWVVPSPVHLKQAVVDTCLGKINPHVQNHVVKQALNKLAPKDKRTLCELVLKGYGHTYAAHLLITRTATLLQRDIRRAALDDCLRRMSKGKEIKSTALSKARLMEKEIYWIVEDGTPDEDFGKSGKTSGIYTFEGKRTGRDIYLFTDLHSGEKREIYAFDNVRFYEYIEVAEAITRAQHAFMTIELDHGRKFVYDAFMEFSFLREPLRQLLFISQTHCSFLDDAKMNVLQRIQHSIASSEIDISELEPGHKYFVYNQFGRKGYVSFIPRRAFVEGDPEFDSLKGKKIVRCPPQSMIVVGGGPTGLITTLHCTENVLLSDGKIKLLESRDAFLQAGATFERAQIVRLDARWIGMLRYHTGTLFEDVWIPASGETDPHYGNTLPTQGFIEITIKDMEAMMNTQVIKLASRHLIGHDTNAGAQYDVDSNTLVKLGKALKVDDLILRGVDPNGKSTGKKETEFSWRITEISNQEGIPPHLCKLGESYQLYVPKLHAVLPYRFIGTNMKEKTFAFEALDKLGHDINGTVDHLPDIYPVDMEVKHGATESITVECVLRSHDGTYQRETIPFSKVENEPFKVDVGETHVCEAIGKVVGPTHIATCTYEPYGVACLAGLKVCMGMHKFGTPRWENGLIDDIRSHTDQNTRVIGDFTKTVNTTVIAEKMYEFLTKDPDWKLHWEKLIGDLKLGDALRSEIFPRLKKATKELVDAAPYRRSHLQTRFFETGDNFYLGMEFTREYDAWKKRTADDLVDSLTGVNDKTKGRAKGVVQHHLDRLWYDGCLETIRAGDVYNPGGNYKVPRLYLIDSLTDVKLSSLDEKESFRVSADPTERYEILMREGSSWGQYVVRDVEGHISKMPGTTVVRRGGNLTRNPGGNVESKVSLATFPVSHYVNHRTMRLSNSDHGYVFAFLGDEQATPHFMRYSGLTGACINSMLFSNFIGDAIHGDEFIDRFRRYSCETNWSNGEVVTRGTGANYGEDGFLRPGAPYKEWVRYLMSKVGEYREMQCDLNQMLSRDWKIKIAAAVVPRGFEYNKEFLGSLRALWAKAVFDQLVVAAEKDKKLAAFQPLGEALKERHAAMGTMEMSDAYWDSFVDGLQATAPAEVTKRLADEHCLVAKRVVQLLAQCVEYAQGAFDRNERISSQLETQPKSVDSFIDDFASEGQSFSNSLATTTTYGAAALALGTIAGTTSSTGVRIPSIIFSVFSPLISMNTIANASRYKNRNEDWRVKFKDERYVHVLKGIYNCMAASDQQKLPLEINPHWKIIEMRKNAFVANVKYYDIVAPIKFLEDYDEMVKGIHDPAAVKKFMSLIVTRYAVDDTLYAVSSYLQQDLVELYGALEELAYALDNRPALQGDGAQRVAALFERLHLFEPRLETSLQRGSILFGYIKQRKFKHGHLPTLLEWLWTKIYPSFACCGSPRTVAGARAARGSCIKPIATESKEIVAQFKDCMDVVPKPFLYREYMDVQSLYHASVESQVMSFVITSSTITVITFFVFIVSQICRAASSDRWAKTLVDVATGMSTSNQPVTALLSTFHLLRLLILLASTGCTVAGKVGKAATPDAKRKLRHVYCMSFVSFCANLMRMSASIAAAVSIPWNLAATVLVKNASGPLNRDYPSYVAIAAVSTHVISVFTLLFIEYTIRWSLDTQLGAYICSVFVDEIKAMKTKLSLPKRSIDPGYVHERTAWEYVARDFLHHYRFDVVFQANRFGSIFQTLQNAWSKPLTQMETRTYASQLTSGIFVSGDIVPDGIHHESLVGFKLEAAKAEKAGKSADGAIEAVDVVLKDKAKPKLNWGKLREAQGIQAPSRLPKTAASQLANVARDLIATRVTAKRDSNAAAQQKASSALTAKRLTTAVRLQKIAVSLKPSSQLAEISKTVRRTSTFI